MRNLENQHQRIARSLKIIGLYNISENYYLYFEFADKKSKKTESFTACSNELGKI